MTVLRMKSEPQSSAPTGGSMDRVIEKRGLSTRTRIIAGGVAALLLLIGAWWFAPRGESQTVDASRLTVSTVKTGTFDDFLPLRGRVTPLLTVYLDAVEGGRVEKILVEDGATVTKGQLLAELSNADLQLSTLARETEVAEQLNNLRTTELNLSRNRLENERNLIQADLDANKAKRQYEIQRPLADKGFVAGRTFRDTTDDYQYQLKRNRVLREAQATDERLQTSQLAQLRATANSLQSALAIARGNLEQLKLRAPVAGQLTAFSIQVGQSMSRGERIGQIDSPGRTKIVAGVDEFYLGRVEPGQIATIERDGKPYRMKVAKIYPQVKNGEFEVDLWFLGAEPEGMQRGQTIQTRLTLGDPSRARLIPNGSFYNDTGGSWVFVVAPDGKSAVRRDVRLGRRNSDFIEVLDGLDPGEKVITSSYSGLVDKTGLDIKRD
ncbi:efflux RND transporter periplasmic adaptor subunit [Sphingomonas montanisoli]|uniref:Efflux RND transporter periplasmic adaptor subunit n=1 Tax=Sphingomonas montanisoli TaxID=2606412 RepID=A0A5D9CCB8_9SPHN|nr:efflux RND transporter periplasmic adaptor subunit [Sphingomonas montanisoli]TZG28782.1 efflux RND transporter periplasmic adaptor subunit [Sphingomonas montanisoli]